MESFVRIAFSFPTVVFTALLAFAVLFWLVSLLGLFDSDSLMDGLDGGDGGLEGAEGVLAAFLLRFQLQGYPLTLVFTLLSLLGWWMSYYWMLFISDLLPFAWLRYPIGVLLLPLALYFAAWLSGYLLRPLRKLFVQGEVRAHHFVGKTAVVRTSRVDGQFGEAMVNDGGAGLIVQVRSVEPLAQGERVVLLQFDAQKHVYHVVRELEDNEQERS